MSHDEDLAQRVWLELSDIDTIDNRKMFDGFAVIFRGNMLCGVLGNGLLVRVEQLPVICSSRNHMPPPWTSPVDRCGEC